MPQLTVYKASAGSGKTFRLTVEYLKLLLRNPEAYRHILAVTFTNKATAEMKERILQSLGELCKLDTDVPIKGIAQVLGNELQLTPLQIRSNAQIALTFLLHDYGRFRIETIDSFFQSILRNLARELGLGAWLNIELNNGSVLNDAVDALMDKADKNPELLLWLTEYIEEMLEEGRSWKIEQELKSFGQNIFKEYFKEKEVALKVKLNDKNFLKNYRKLLKAIELENTEKLQKLAEPFFTLLSQEGLVVEDFSYKTAGPCGYFIKLQKGEASSAIYTSSRLQAALADPAKWTNKSSKLNNQITALAEASINPMIEKIEMDRQHYWKALVTTRLAVKHLNQVGLLSDIASEVRTLNLENHRFLLSDTNALLKSLLEGSDASFIYEKTGSELHHILFDEFQDTSRMQWDTFKPLLMEGLANGNDSLIVGDEKQSIYRWRNGDWRILGNIRREIKSAEVEEKSLESNWRSAREVVTFNNNLFKTLETKINALHENLFGSKSADLQNAYSDVEQIPERQEEHGHVELTFVGINDIRAYRQQVLTYLIRKVEALQREGVKPHDIAVLIRYNKEIPEIGSAFAEYKNSPQADPSLCYDIVSDEAFLLRSSKSVQIIIDALQLLNDPTNPIPQALLKLDYQSDVLVKETDLHPLFRQNSTPAKNKLTDKTAYKKLFVNNTPVEDLLPIEFIERFDNLQRLPLHELVEELYRIFELQRIQAQDSYLHCFMDKLSEYLMHASADIASFLQHWEEVMSETSIPSGSVVQGIRILSIHKSKGLEFHTVLLPFCDWNLLENRKLKVWCQPKQAPYDQMDLLPIDYGSDMNESAFSDEFAEETLQLWVDALNLLYVAYTRARLNLYIWCQGTESVKKYNNPKTIGHLLEDTLKEGLNGLPEGQFTEAAPLAFEPLVSAGWSDEDSDDDAQETTSTEMLVASYSLGLFNPGNPLDSKADSTSDITLPFRSYAHKTKFRQSNRSREFCKGEDSEETTSSYIERGNLLHTLFQEIRVREDVPIALQKLLHEGLLSTEEAAVYESYVQHALELPDVSDWYSGKYTLYNECSILSVGQDGKLQMKRPDRVMVDQEEVLVVDFKFGKPKATHQTQVKTYIQLLKGMGHTQVRGFLWYVDENRIQTI